MHGPIEVDACVIGAGVGGIYATHRLTKLGLSVKCIDKAGDVGGTWYWNRYPGAMSDTESYLYRYSWDKEDLQTYPWSSHYIYQPDILAYLNHVVEKHDLRKHMQFDTGMETAKWSEDLQRWTVTCDNGEVITARYLINSLGLLSRVNFPDIDGRSSFKGQIIHTARWDPDVQLEGKKVGIIGNGSTGVQVMTALSPIVGQLTSFQRSPQYSVPSGQGHIPDGYRESINKSYDQIWKNVWSSSTGFGVPESTRKTMETPPAERRIAFEKVWSQGNGFRFMFSAFGDITTDRAANEEACEFIRGKIDSIVQDPRKASILKPRDLYARRPLCDTGYYQIFNRSNVDVVDIKANPIRQIVPDGVELSDGSVHELDVLIFATGFDAIEGSYNRVAIVGKDGQTLRDHWRNGPTTYGGIACAGFPNMFLIAGPQGPFANFPPVIESEIELIMASIEHAEANISQANGQRSLNGHSEANGTHEQANGFNGIFVIDGSAGDHESVSKNGSRKNQATIIDVKPEAEKRWVDRCNELVQGSLFTTTKSWIFGVNIPGRKPNTNFFFGGLDGYRDWTASVAKNGFLDYIF